MTNRADATAEIEEMSEQELRQRRKQHPDFEEGE
jgi:hypothetical protein